MIRDRKDIPLFKDVSDAEWNDYRWQLRNRLTTTDGLRAACSTSPTQQRKDLDACMGKFRVSVTPYYASLMDPDDPTDPVRMQGVPTPAELVIHAEDLEDAVSEDFDSPTPRITHRYPDRVLFVVTEMCSMYCRHCTRRRLVGGTEDIVARGRDRQRHQVHRARPRGPRRAHQRRRPAGAQRRAAREHHRARARHRPRGDHPPRLAHAGRLPAAHHPRAGGDAEKYQPALLQHPLQPPAGVHAREQAGLRPPGRRRHPPGQPDGAHARHQRLRQRDEEARRTSCCSTASSPTTTTSATSPQGTAHFRTSVAKGIEIYESLRGHTTGFGVPTYIIDAIGGGGKTPVFPNYVISQAPGKVVLRNYEGVISKYTEPDDYVEGECHCEDCDDGARAARRRRHVRRGARPHAERGLGRAHAEGRRPQEPHGRRLRAGQGLRPAAEGRTGQSPCAAGSPPVRQGENVPKVFVEPIGITLTVDEQENLLDGLVRAQIDIPTDCAGRGTCGKCLVRLGSGELTAPTERELKRIPEKLRAEGWRLACQAYPRSARVSIEVRGTAGQRRILTTSKLTHGAAHPAVARCPCSWSRRRSPTSAPTWSASTRVSAASRCPLHVLAVPARHAARRQVEGHGDLLRQARHRRASRASASRELYGVAVDIGTSKVIAYLFDLARGALIDQEAVENPQMRYGEDVISRIAHAAQHNETAAAGRGRARRHQHEPRGALRAPGHPRQPRLRHDRGRQHGDAPPRPRPLARRPRPGAVRAGRGRAAHAARE